MKKPSRLLTIADILFTLLCLIAAVCWYLNIPYRIEVTSVLAVLAIAVLVFMRKGFKSESAFLSSYSQLLENESHFRSAFEYAAFGMALVSTDGHFLKVNYSLAQLLNSTEDELLKLSIRKFVYPEDFRNLLNKIKQINSGASSCFQTIIRFLNKDKEIIWVEADVSSVYDKNHQPLYFVTQFQNISAKNPSTNQFKNMAYTDSLTGLSNRAFLDRQVGELIDTSGKLNKTFALFLLDLDGLKNINESIGQNGGDQLLKLIAERIKNVVRSEDIVARIGGDEFAIVVNNVSDVVTIGGIAQKILTNLLKAMTINNREIYITASVGISLYPNDGQDVESLIRNADLALYRVKKNHGNNYQFYEAEITQKAQEKSKQQSALNSAISKNELQLYYQPCVQVADQQVTCLEALIRWQSDKYGLVMPDTIIPLAEESGLIVPLSEWVVRTACKQVKVWQAQGNPTLKLSINISAYQFKNLNFTNNIIRALKEAEFPANLFILEIAEGLIMHDYKNAIAILAKLKKEGIGVVIDDFGTGFSSFDYLTNYSVNKIKIDKTFIDKIPTDISQKTIVAAMISMASKLGIKTVAEGVETEAQREILLKEGCDEMQGYYVAKPLPIELMESFLTVRKTVKTQ